jgi:hypothetical protein
MRLLRTKDRQFEEIHDPEKVRYGILSHTWVPGEELSLKEWYIPEYHVKSGYKKIRDFCELARAKYALDYVWVDTVCIDKSNSTEFSKSITCRL